MDWTVPALEHGLRGQGGGAVHRETLLTGEPGWGDGKRAWMPCEVRAKSRAVPSESRRAQPDLLPQPAVVAAAAVADRSSPSR